MLSITNLVQQQQLIQKKMEVPIIGQAQLFYMARKTTMLRNKLLKTYHRIGLLMELQ